MKNKSHNYRKYAVALKRTQGTDELDTWARHSDMVTTVLGGVKAES